MNLLVRGLLTGSRIVIPMNEVTVRSPVMMAASRCLVFAPVAVRFALPNVEYGSLGVHGPLIDSTSRPNDLTSLLLIVDTDLWS